MRNEVLTVVTILSSYVSVAGFALGLGRKSDLAFGVGVAAFILVFFLLVKGAKDRAKSRTTNPPSTEQSP